MVFNENNKAIYLQIADKICDDIMLGALKDGDRIPSVREYAASMEVNANTVMRSYEYLERNDVIFNRRGIGFSSLNMQRTPSEPCAAKHFSTENATIFSAN